MFRNSMMHVMRAGRPLRMALTILAIAAALPVMPAPSLAQSADGEAVKFFKGGWDESLARAKESGKYLYVDGYTDWCGWCEELDKKTFSDATVARFMHEHFVPVKFDMEEGDGLRLAMKYRVIGFPISLVFSHEGRLLYRQFGYAPPADFINMLTPALDPAKQLVLPGISDDLDPDWPDFLHEAYAKGERKWPNDSTIAAWLAAREDWFDEISWSVIFRFGGGEQGQRFLLDNRHRLAQLYGKDEIEDKLSGIVWRQLSGAAERRSRAGLDSALAQADTLLDGDRDQRRMWMQVTYFKEAQEWTEFVRSYGRLIDTAKVLPHTSVNNNCWELYEQCDDPDALRTAVAWMKRVTDEKPTWMFLDTYAALLYKSGALIDAEREAVRAIEAGKQEQVKTKSTQDLLAKIRDKMK